MRVKKYVQWGYTGLGYAPIRGPKFSDLLYALRSWVGGGLPNLTCFIVVTMKVNIALDTNKGYNVALKCGSVV